MKKAAHFCDNSIAARARLSQPLVDNVESNGFKTYRIGMIHLIKDFKHSLNKLFLVVSLNSFTADFILICELSFTKLLFK